MADTSVGRRTKIENTTRNTGVAKDKPAGLRLSKTEGQLILKRFIEECFPPFQNIQGRFRYAVDWAGNWKETIYYADAIKARNRRNPTTFELEKFVVLKSVNTN